MTRGSNVFVFVALIATCSLIGACGDGQGASRSCEDEPTPAPTETGEPYGHVVPSDVGVSIGVGVVGPVPTKVYNGPLDPGEGTVIEDVIINGCLDINHPNITLRNVIVNCDGLYPLQIKNASDTLIEYSQLNCMSESKLFDVQDSQRTVIRNNEGTGCRDFFFIDGPLETLLVENNYFHSLVGGAEAHADGFQIGEFRTTTGDIIIRGNYFDPNNDAIGKTDLVFATNKCRANLLVENNFFNVWGWYTLRNSGEYSIFTVRNNIYSQDFKTEFRTDGSPARAYRHCDCNPAPSGGYSCNRYQDGSFIEQDYVSGDTHSIADCPSY